MKHFNASSSDEDLLRNFSATHNRQSFDVLYSRYFRSLWKYLKWLSHETDGCADIAQNIFLKLYEKPEICDPNRNFKVWLFSSAKNLWKNEIRNRSTRQEHLRSLATQEAKYPEDTDTQSARLAAISKAIEGLNETHREVFVLKYSNNLSIEEIAEICQLPQGTVKSRLFYALKQLKNKVNPIKDLQE